MLHIFNKLKKLLLLFLLILLTGCEAEYNIEINNNINLKETINIIEKDETKFNEKSDILYKLTPKEYLETNLKWPTQVYQNDEVNPYEPIKLDNTKYYTKTDISNYNMLGISYSYNHNQNRYNNTDIINKCYNIKYSKNNDNVSFETIGEFKCFDEYKLLDKVIINLNTTCKVNKENADKKDKNKYIWYITKENYKDKKIKFQVGCTNKKDTMNNIDGTSLIIVFVVMYLLLIGTIIAIIKMLQLKNNKI